MRGGTIALVGGGMLLVGIVGYIALRPAPVLPADPLAGVVPPATAGGEGAAIAGAVREGFGLARDIFASTRSAPAPAPVSSSIASGERATGTER